MKRLCYTIKLRMIPKFGANAMPYMTNHKKRILDFLIQHRSRHFAIEEIIEALSVDDTKPAKSTIYRQISALLEDGVIRRFEAPDQNCFVYQYAAGIDCAHHFHLKCSRCGTLIHMECEQLEEVQNHIRRAHGFLIGGNSVIYGICAACTAETVHVHK